MNNKRAILAELTEQAKRERDEQPDWKLPLILEPHMAVALVANLQLALRHPGNQGIPRAVARQVIDGIIARFTETGMTAFAMMAALGDDPAYDDLPDPDK